MVSQPHPEIHRGVEIMYPQKDVRTVFCQYKTDVCVGECVTWMHVTGVQCFYFCWELPNMCFKKKMVSINKTRKICINIKYDS